MIDLGLERIEVRQEANGRYTADRPHLAGAPVVGRGNTWLEALGDLLIQDIDRFGVQAFVYDRDGELVPPEFFSSYYRRD